MCNHVHMAYRPNHARSTQTQSQHTLPTGQPSQHTPHGCAYIAIHCSNAPHRRCYSLTRCRPTFGTVAAETAHAWLLTRCRPIVVRRPYHGGTIWYGSSRNSTLAHTRRQSTRASSCPRCGLKRRTHRSRKLTPLARIAARLAASGPTHTCTSGAVRSELGRAPTNNSLRAISYSS